MLSGIATVPGMGWSLVRPSLQNFSPTGAIMKGRFTGPTTAEEDVGWDKDEASRALGIVPGDRQRFPVRATNLDVAAATEVR